MGWLKRFVKWSQKRFILKWIFGILFMIVGIFGWIMPIIQGIPLMLMGFIIIVPNKKLSKKIFKYERIITWSLIVGFAILLITPAVLYYYGFFPTKYGRFALTTLQIGQNQIQTLFKP